MKKSKFFAFAALGMLLASCSSDDSVTQEPAVTGNGYLSVNINLPTTSSTRAQNDKYDDGLPKEYNVSDMKLLLFQGDSESDATYWQTIILGDQAGVDDVDDDNITTTYRRVGKVVGTATDQLWALVMINTNGVNMPELTNTTKIADLQKYSYDLSFINENNIFMTNAVLSSAAGGTVGTAPTKGALKVLTQLNADCIKPTEEEAKNNPAGSIFVERAVAKATLKVEASKVGDYDIKDTKWVLDNTQKESYLVRNMGELDPDYMGYSSEKFGTTPNYRFAGNAQIGETAIQPTVDLYRTYWCIDPVYAKDATADDMTSATDVTGETGTDNPQYCKENTFDVAHQTYKNTTRAIIKVVLHDGVTFYSINGAQEFGTQETAEADLKGVFIKNAGVVNALQASLNAATTYEVNENSFVFGFTTDATGQYKLESAELTDEAKAKFDATKLATNFTEEVRANAYKIANENYVIRKYTDGVMYYTARFQHFADNADAANDLAPWNNWEADPKPAMGTTENVYPGTNAEQNYLGRYGMVRNNWYDVTVTEFKKFGDPVIPSVDIDTPDDNINDQYISVKINVLAWAKRTQNWSF